MARTAEQWTTAFSRIVEDDQSRRELLWIRAKEKGDVEHAQALVSVDPGVKARLWFFHDVSFDEVDLMPEEHRKRTYARLYDAHLSWLIG